MAPQKLNFIIIDDSKLDCFIADKIIRNSGRAGEIHAFTSAPQALEHISTAIAPQADDKTTVLLDIQMPVMNGFDFMEAFEKLPDTTKAGYNVYMLSSSINENDLNRVKNYTSIKQFLNKPLTSDALGEILEGI
jgi:CheY-like chemotaxis protein